MQTLRARRDPPVDLAHHHGAAPAEQDHARRDVIGTEIDESADGALRAHHLGDHPLVEAVLERNHAAVLGEMRRQSAGGSISILSLDAEKHGLEATLHLLRERGAHGHLELGHRSGDGEALRRHGGHVVGRAIDEEQVVSRTREVRAYRAADRSRAPDQNGLPGHLRPLAAVDETL